ncbi:MAG TPA: hypothetical protein ENK06_04630, partial [Gammaproteobacteria bacterium]|nr:hypothetical protein [Gammaproteobacteria bacterium]
MTMTVTKKTQSKKYLALMIGAIIAGTAGMAQASTERVSVTTGHKQSGHDSTADTDLLPDNLPTRAKSTNPDISADSRFVVFESRANNLAGNKADGSLKDTNNTAAGFNNTDIFVHDRRLHTTERVNVNSSGAQSVGPASDPSISEDGRYIAFVSAATDLVIGDTGAFTDIFVHDRQTGETRRVSVTASGAQANGNSTEPFISNNGRYVSFTSEASNLLGNKPGVTPAEPVDNNGVADIYRVDLQSQSPTDYIKRISFGRNNDDGTPDEANGASGHSSMSTNGQLIAFHSDATNLLGYERKDDGTLDTSKPLDKNGKTDVFWVDINAYSTHLASVDSAYIQGDDDSTNPVISSDGKYIAFQSDASNLVKGDNNGVTDIFRHETRIDQNVFGGDTIRVSVNSNPTVNQADAASTNPDINGNGDIVVFESVATNLVSDDTNGFRDIFSRKVSTGETKRLSVDNDNNSKKNESNLPSSAPSIASYGTAVAFESDATNLLLNELEDKPGKLQPEDTDTTISNKDTNKSTDIFVSFINRKPDFYIANQTVCKNAGIQDAHIIQNVSDGDYLGVNQSIAYTTVSNSNPDLFGGLLGAGGEPF